ncbi:hypothetical protein [Nocardioides conyzicola]|uniref:Uncharacterized protein n=1 Tax=Nocardioides conyzicola TaxID=1651781 RepID=A0ABP8XCS3_9ACTN
MSTNGHQGVLTRHHANKFAFHCCVDGPEPFSAIWNASGSSVSEMVFGSPAQVFQQIVTHLTDGRSDNHTATVVAAANNQSGLTDDVVAGVRVLHEQLPYVTVTVTG